MKSNTKIIQQTSSNFKQDIIFVDTPNLIFTRKFSAIDVIEAIISYISNIEESMFVFVVTPKLRKEHPECVKKLKWMRDTFNNVDLLYTPKGVDPDLFFLYYANLMAITTNLSTSVLSNDKFRGGIYKPFLNNLKLVKFRFIQSKKELTINTLKRITVGSA